MQLAADNTIESTLMFRYPKGSDAYDPRSEMIHYEDLSGSTFGAARSELAEMGYHPATTKEWQSSPWNALRTEAYAKTRDGFITIVVIEA